MEYRFVAGEDLRIGQAVAVGAIDGLIYRSGGGVTYPPFACATIDIPKGATFAVFSGDGHTADRFEIVKAPDQSGNGNHFVKPETWRDRPPLF